MNLGWRRVYPATLLILLALVVYAAHEFDEVLFDPITADSILGLLTPLFVIALFLERTQEVFVSSWRRKGRDDLEIRKAKLEKQLNEAQQALKTLNETNPSEANVQLAEARINDLRDKLVSGENEIARYKGQTSRMAFRVGVTAGILVSVVGVRVLHPLMDADHELDGLQGLAFDSLDIFITGGLLGGGSDGVHKAVSVITDFLDATRDKIKL